MPRGEQTTLTEPGYCAMTGRAFPELAAGDDCPLCGGVLDGLPELGDADDGASGGYAPEDTDEDAGGKSGNETKDVTKES